MAAKKRPPHVKPSDRRPADAAEGEAREPQLRIIGGSFRGRKLLYTVDERTRPMKDRVREAVFNLIGPGIAGKHAIDLFAGTGALGLESVSRGAASALMLERHFPTADIIRQNVAKLGAAELCRVVPADTLIWATRELPPNSAPWVVFCSPPYDLYISRQDDLLGLLKTLVSMSPPESVFVVEADERFDFGLLPHAADWDVRTYPPAIVGLWEKPV